jgi:hypothetical protein
VEVPWMGISRGIVKVPYLCFSVANGQLLKLVNFQ